MITVDLSQFSRMMAKAHFKKQDLLDVEGPGALVLINGMRMRAPWDTGALRASINQHIIESTDTRLVDDVGPEVEYGPYIEYGTGIYAEGGQGRKGGWRYKDAHGNWHFTYGMRPQPFMRPAADEDKDQVVAAVEAAIKSKLKELG
jgi:HK97 gp10 family phage protein